MKDDSGYSRSTATKAPTLIPLPHQHVRAHTLDLLRLCDERLRPMILALLEWLEKQSIPGDDSDDGQAFLARLCQLCPTLTPMELRVCMLLRMNMTTRQIASYMSLSPRSVESHRYRIRRKLEIPEGVGIVGVLAGI